MDNIKKIENILQQVNVGDDKKSEFIKNEVIGKKSEDIINLLVTLAPEEHGGITALSGFYYQFLVTLEYLCELYEGKWDFVAIELHDDIVVGKDNKIKFVQVKTSESNYIEVTDSKVGLYSRKNKKIDDIDIKLNNSWVDKLLSKAEYFRKDDDYSTEFELVTSYEIIRSSRIDINVYKDPNMNKTISDDDYLYTTLNNEVYDTNQNIYSYNDKTGEDLKDLLRRFSIKKRYNMCEIGNYEGILCHKLSMNMFSEIDAQNITITKEDLYKIIGFICSQCNVNSENASLIITRDYLKEITKSIFDDTLNKACEVVSNYGTKETLDKILNKINAKYDVFSIYKDNKAQVDAYFNYLLDWLKDKGGIRSLINKYMAGTNNSAYYEGMDIEERNEKLTRLFIIIMVLSFIYKNSLRFYDNQSLLTKIIPEDEELISFFGLELSDTFDIGVKKLQSILESNSPKDELAIFNKLNSIIFEGYQDDWVGDSKIMEIRSKITPDINGLDDGASINEVTYITKIVPGNYLIDNHKRFFNYQDIKSLREIWDRLRNEVECNELL